MCILAANIPSIDKISVYLKLGINESNQLTLNRNKGINAEDEAAAFLTKKGYELVERNFRHGRREIDLIVKKSNVLVFVEVKMRTSNAFGYPESFVSEKQAERITEAAEEYQISFGWEGIVRFDIVSIEKIGGQTFIRHFEDAFY